MTATEPSLFLVIVPLHVAFFLSFAVPGLCLALAGETRPLRRNRIPLWLGAGFALPTIILCLLLSAHSGFWYFYPVIYAVLVAVPTAVRLASAPALKVLEDSAGNIRVANDAKAKAVLGRNYNYRCVPCEEKAASAV